MLHDKDLKDIYRSNIVVKLRMIKEISVIYIKCLVLYPNNIELRRKLIRLMKGFFINLNNEKDILYWLDESYLTDDDFYDFVDCLDDYFVEAWNYYNSILGDFEDALAMDNLDRVMYQNEVVKKIDEEMKQEIRHLILEKEKNNRSI